MFLGQPKGVSAILTILSLLPIPQKRGGERVQDLHEDAPDAIALLTLPQTC